MREIQPVETALEAQPRASERLPAAAPLFDVVRLTTVSARPAAGGVKAHTPAA